MKRNGNRVYGRYLQKPTLSDGMAWRMAKVWVREMRVQACVLKWMADHLLFNQPNSSGDIFCIIALLPHKYTKHLFVACEYLISLCIASQMCTSYIFVLNAHKRMQEKQQQKEKNEDGGGHFNPFTTYIKTVGGRHKQTNIQTDTRSSQCCFACWFNDEEVWGV